MPLSAAKPGLEQQIYTAYQKVKAAGSEDGADSDQIILELAMDITEAIHSYVTQAMVTTTVAPGIPVTTAGSAVAQTGASSGPGSGIGSLS
jgi:hypothetical protein